MRVLGPDGEPRGGVTEREEIASWDSFASQPAAPPTVLGDSVLIGWSDLSGGVDRGGILRYRIGADGSVSVEHLLTDEQEAQIERGFPLALATDGEHVAAVLLELEYGGSYGAPRLWTSARPELAPIVGLARNLHVRQLAFADDGLRMVYSSSRRGRPEVVPLSPDGPVGEVRGAVRELPAEEALGPPNQVRAVLEEAARGRLWVRRDESGRSVGDPIRLHLPDQLEPRVAGDLERSIVVTHRRSAETTVTVRFIRCDSVLSPE